MLTSQINLVSLRFLKRNTVANVITKAVTNRKSNHVSRNILTYLSIISTFSKMLLDVNIFLKLPGCELSRSGISFQS